MSPHPLLVLSLSLTPFWLQSLIMQMGIVDLAADSNLIPSELRDSHQKECIIAPQKESDRSSLCHIPIPEPITWPETGAMIVRFGHM